jgi:hypothetical protein
MNNQKSFQMSKINSKLLGVFTDNILGVDYGLEMVMSAKELSDELKSVLAKKGIDYNQFNGHKAEYSDKSNPSENPPAEIYEYQNFFILQRKNGELILLDGFRRLLWYNAPSTPITARFYLEGDLTNQQILTLLVNLNHFKFFSDQAYHERGFSLLLKTVFDIDIMNMKKSFDAYLSSKETKNSYSNYGQLTKQSKNEEIKRRIVNEYFISDLRFLQAIQSEGFLADQYMGALTYEMRSGSDKEFDSTKFISLVKENKVLLDLMEKYKKVGTDNSAKSQDVVNKIIEMYRNIFTIMDGGEVAKSFAEQQREAKDLVEKLKKDKTLVKVSGSQQIYDIERKLVNKIEKGEEIEFVCVVHPKQHEETLWNRDDKTPKIPYGILDGVKFIDYYKKHFTEGHGNGMNFGVILDGYKFVIKHNFQGKKYTYIESSGLGGGNRYDIDLFVKMELDKKPKSTEPRKMKEFSYNRGMRDGMKYCVLAWTQKEARELFASVGIHLSDKDMRDFVGNAFGNDGHELLKDQDLSSPCVYGIKQDKTIVKLR